MMRLEFDPDKRAKTLLLRGLDFARSAEIFAGPHYTAPDERREYAEARWISLRKANDREKARYAPALG